MVYPLKIKFIIIIIIISFHRDLCVTLGHNLFMSMAIFN